MNSEIELECSLGDELSMHSLAEYCEQLRNASDEFNAQTLSDDRFVKLAHDTCLITRGIEFAIPRESVFGERRIQPIVQMMSAVRARLIEWNFDRKNESVALYAEHIQDRVNYLLTRKRATVAA